MTASTPASKKNKGRLFQQEVRSLLINQLGLDALDVKSTSMGAGGCDISLSAIAREVFPFGIECKRAERINIWQAIKQAEANASSEDLRPLVAFRRSRSDIYVILKIEDFLRTIGGRE